MSRFKRDLAALDRALAANPTPRRREYAERVERPRRMTNPAHESPQPTGETAATAEATEARLDALCGSHDVSDARKKNLALAIEAGASDKVLVTLRDAVRVHRGGSTIVLPPGRYEHLSRGRGWARRGRAAAAVWGERVENGYRVGPGRWTVGSTDGFSRKSAVDWTVQHVTVGAETWTVAS